MKQKKPKPVSVSVRTVHGTELLEPKADPAGESQAGLHRERVLRLMRYDRARMAARLEQRPAPLMWEDLPAVRPSGPMATPKEVVPPASAFVCAAMADRIVVASLCGAAVALAVCAVAVAWR